MHVHSGIIHVHTSIQVARPSVDALLNAFAAEPVATAGDAGLLDARHANGTLEVLIQYSNLHIMSIVVVMGFN